jgi:carbohydrate-selective porin OprB
MRGVWMPNARYVWAALLGSASLVAPGAASAQPVDVPPTWGGDFWDRPRLTGSWWGLRDELGKKGVVLDIDALLTPQGVLSGGKDNPNPIQYSYAAGIGGKGVIPGRPHDDFGIGWARTQFSDKFVPLLRQDLDLGLDHEDAVEIFYNAAITPWLRVTLDLQIVNPALKKTLDTSRTALKNVDTAVVGGARMYIRF